jgi:hypothetical protein
MTIMTTHGSATGREPHVNQATRTNTIVHALKRRAQAFLNDKSIDAQSRAIIRYALEINDPWLAELVRRADAGEPISDTLYLLTENRKTKSAALLMLMATIENSTHSKALVNTTKHLAFTRYGELNLYGMVDPQNGGSRAVGGRRLADAASLECGGTSMAPPREKTCEVTTGGH